MKLLAALAIWPAFAFAQEIDSPVERLDTLAGQIETLDLLVKDMSKFKVSAYIQGQYQYGQKDASLKVGDKNEDPEQGFNRIGIRRGRMKFAYDDGLGTGAIQIEVNDKGVSFRDLYIGIRDPWTRQNRLMAGVFNRPFGHEVTFSTSNLESPERATVIQYFFPDERDLGAMLALRMPKESSLHFLTLDAGLFAGNSINRETDNRKDFIGRLGASKAIGQDMEWGLGASYYNGSVFNPTSTSYEMQEGHFVAIDQGRTGTFMKREYFGVDAQFSFNSSMGKTELRAEGLWGTQPGIASSSRSPNYSTRPTNDEANALYARPFLGYFFYFIQDIGTSPFSFVLKYDAYDPNTKLKGDETGRPESLTSATDLAQHTVGLGGLYRFNKHIRLQAYYEVNRNETSANVAGYEKDRKDNVLTIRLQYKF